MGALTARTAALLPLLLLAACADDPQAPPAAAPTHDLVFEGVLADAPELLRLDAATGELARVLPPGTVAMDPAPSPDGAQIAFVVADYVEFTGDIFVCDRDGGNPVNLTPDPLPGITDERSPCWSPDGARLAYISTAGGNRDVWTMAADGSDPRQLVSTIDLEAEPSWSPDGSVIAYRRSSQEDGSEIWLVPAAGGEASGLALAGEQRQPVWSPDGTRLLFIAQATIGDRPDLWEMRADGAGARRLVGDDVPGGCVNPAFLRRAD